MPGLTARPCPSQVIATDLMGLVTHNKPDEMLFECNENANLPIEGWIEKERPWAGRINTMELMGGLEALQRKQLDTVALKA